MYQVNRLIKISGTGSAVPNRVVPNAELVDRAHSNDAWIRENLGILERRIVSPEQRTSDLAAEAGRRALQSAGITGDDVDLIIVATATPDRWAPSTACIVQHKLGIVNRCPAFDLNAVCSGFLYAMSVGSQFIQSGIYKTAKRRHSVSKKWGEFAIKPRRRRIPAREKANNTISLICARYESHSL